MQVAARVPWSDLEGGGIVGAYGRGVLPPELRGPGLDGIAAVTAARSPMDPHLLDALVSELDADAAPPWRGLADPSARAVVTGQQPGCAGGVLLVLYKAATAVALARRAHRSLRCPVVPVFWNASDDVDFDEIARVAWPDGKGGVLWLELPAAARQAQGLVGDLPAAGDLAASRSALALVGPRERAALEPMLPDTAPDHGTWVARFLRRVFPQIAVLDARSAAFRRQAAPLFARYLDVRAEAETRLRAAASALAAAGFAPALAPQSARLGLFLTAAGQRRKLAADTAPLHEALRAAPETVAPNVVLRPLVQDLLLPVVASVVGASELVYLLELRNLRPLLGVPEVPLVPRLGMTVLDDGAWRSARQLDLGLPELLGDGDAALRAVARRRAAPALEAARAAFAALRTGLEPLQSAPTYAEGAGRALRRAEPLRQELEKQVEDAALRELLAAHPALGAWRAGLRPRGKLQERTWAALWLVARWGKETGPRLVELADAHLQALERGEAMHQIVVDG